MSYILDALRRANAERERGEVPGLSSQQHTLVADDDEPTAGRSRLLIAAVVALSVVLAGVLGWALLGGGSASAPPRQIAEGSVTPAPAMAPTPVTAAPPATAATTPNTATTGAGPSPTTATTTSASTATTTERRASRRATTTNAAASNPGGTSAALPAATTGTTATRTAPTPATTTATSATTAATSTATAARGSRAAATEQRVYAQAELPDEIRREIPKIAINGASYSGDAASRMIIVNGQVFHEGDKLGQNLVLEKIKLRSAVLAFKGYRYEVTF